MLGDDHVRAARDVYDLAAHAYVEFAGTRISPATEGSVDRSLLDAFVELVTRQSVSRVADLGCGPGRVARYLADRGLDVIGIDVSLSLLAVARSAHPDIKFQEGQLDALPLATGVLGGAVSWYSIIYTPPDRLDESFDELARALVPGGVALMAFQADGEPVHRENAFGTHLPLTSYRHSVSDIVARFEKTGFKLHATVVRAPDLQHETSAQGFVIATAPTP